MLLKHAASVATTAMFAAGPAATLAPTILAVALAVAPAPGYAQTSAFGAPVTVNDAAAPNTDATPEAHSAPPADARAFAAPVAALPTAAPPAPAMAATTTPAVVAQAAPVVAPSSTWRVEVADMNVRRVIERWSRTAGMQVIYEANRDVDIGAAAAFSGTYEHALQQLFAAIESSEMPLRACLYANALTRVIPRMQRCD